MTHTENDSNASGKKATLSIRSATVFLLAVLMVASAGCQQYGSVSRSAYEISTALYSICNRKDETRLPSVQQTIESAAQAGDLSPNEQEWLMAILESAQDGHWQEAMQDARTIMEEQVN